ncbi:MAG TPA: alpha/beta hydrolase [Chitinophagales bacterium]|nr:alpha/beta hydrolase [Chitinophagales bacterium]HMZ33769.1 alpha/beta hydrolase [Chitinophagales bacterium]HNK74957.1 alpha/beta hydrolase [Chitinophagales bacterium]HNN25370.1 alpha/beta hydrolase [Chitinophagales bacterium]
MQSIQIYTVKVFINVVRNILFVHKTEPNTVRVAFERLSNITKYPRFVKKEELNYAGCEAAWFTPDGYIKSKTILYLHGGGYVVGSYNTHRALIARIARAAACKTLAINYRKAPEHHYPLAIEDALNTYKQMIADGYENIFIMGDSAGGGLTLALLQLIKKHQLPKAAGSVLLSPWTDLTMSGDSIRTKKDVDPLITPQLIEIFAKRYFAEADPKDPLISPLFADVSDFPPTLIQVGTNEVLLDDSTRLAKKMNDAGVPVQLEIYKNMMHVWQYLGGIVPEANKAIDEIGAFVKSISVSTTSDNLDRANIY